MLLHGSDRALLLLLFVSFLKPKDNRCKDRDQTVPESRAAMPMEHGMASRGTVHVLTGVDDVDGMPRGEQRCLFGGPNHYHRLDWGHPSSDKSSEGWRFPRLSRLEEFIQKSIRDAKVMRHHHSPLSDTPLTTLANSFRKREEARQPT